MTWTQRKRRRGCQTANRALHKRDFRCKYRRWVRLDPHFVAASVTGGMTAGGNKSVVFRVSNACQFKKTPIKPQEMKVAGARGQPNGPLYQGHWAASESRTPPTDHPITLPQCTDAPTQLPRNSSEKKKRPLSMGMKAGLVVRVRGQDLGPGTDKNDTSASGRGKGPHPCLKKAGKGNRPNFLGSSPAGKGIMDAGSKNSIGP